jgi:prepilin-type processing-associated H-X9-DG protein
MRKQTGLTRVDAAVALACVALVLVHVGVINAGGRERSKREVCMANLRMLTAAWQMYADDNAGKLVNGGQVPWGLSREIRWCTPNNTSPFDWELTLPYQQRVDLLKQGALYRYVVNVEIYRCPEADKNMHRSYIMPTSMNAAWTTDGHTEVAGYPLSKVAKNTGQIAKPNERIVFLEEKIITPDAFEFPYDMTAALCDTLSIMHGNGINLGFADGHAEYHQWECQSTIRWCKGEIYNDAVAADTCFRTKDRVWIRKALWGD